MKIVKNKRFWGSILCLYLMVFCILPGKAAINGCWAHNMQATGRIIDKEILPYDGNPGTHRVRGWEEWKCLNSGCTETEYFEVIINETHSLTFTSLNHWGDLHGYRGTCDCGYTTTVTISCPGGNSHVTP